MLGAGGKSSAHSSVLKQPLGALNRSTVNIYFIHWEEKGLAYASAVA